MSGLRWSHVPYFIRCGFWGFPVQRKRHWFIGKLTFVFTELMSRLHVCMPSILMIAQYTFCLSLTWQDLSLRVVCLSHFCYRHTHTTPQLEVCVFLTGMYCRSLSIEWLAMGCACTIIKCVCLQHGFILQLLQYNIFVFCFFWLA